MGWRGDEITYYKENGQCDRKKEIESLLSDDIEVVKSSMVGSVYYAAVRFNKKNPITGIVVLTRKEGNILHKKLIEETLGPLFCDCPISIIKVLSPTKNYTALDWRNECIENANKKRKGRKKKEALKTQNTEK